MRFGVYDLKELHDVLVVHASKDIDFPVNGHQLAFAGQKLLLVAFQGNLVPTLFVCHLLDGGIRTMAQVLIRDEI